MYNNIITIIVIVFALIVCSEENNKFNNVMQLQAQESKHKVKQQKKETRIIDETNLTLTNDNNFQQENEIQNSINKIVTNSDINAQSATIQQIPIATFNISKNDIVLGNINSNIVVVEYFSPTCPPCAYYNKHIFPKIKAQYIDTNKISYIVREFISNKRDLYAAILARCNGNKDDYLKFHSIILEQQNKWAYSNDYCELLTTIAQDKGISAESYKECCNNNQIIATLIANTNLVGTMPRFIGTPTFFINGVQITEGYSFKILANSIEQILKSTNN